MLEVVTVRGVVYLMHPRKRLAWKINFLHSEIDNSVRRMELARKKNCLAEQYKKVFAFKRKPRRLRKS